MFDFVSFIPRAIVQGIPLLFGSTGETLTEKSGNLNLGIAGIMYVGGISGVIGAFLYEQAAGGAAGMNGFLAIMIPLLSCLLGSLLMGLLYCFLTVTLRANQNVTGLAMTTFGVGFGNFFGGSLIKLTGSEVPSIALSTTSAYFSKSLPFAAKCGWFGQIFLSYGFLAYLAILLALLASYVEEIRIGLLHNGVTELLFTDGTKCLVEQASILDFMSYYNVSLMNPTVLVGVFIGAMMSFLFCGLTMNAVGRAAESMVQEVRRQFREIKGILTGEGTPDYARCVAISTRGAQREMLFPSLLAIIVPVVVGLVFGVAGVMGLLVGGLGSGFVLAVFMANAGGAWDNAKKMVEEGHFGGKGSECHKATVVGDTVGDPFKDTSGPSLNILIKLMSMVAIVMAGLTVAFHLF